jgi:hypothetical protein
MKELPTPPDAERDPEAAELLRAWVVNQELHCSLRVGAFPDPGTWGEVLADVVRHVAQAFQEQEGKDPADVVRVILEVFDAERRPPGGEAPGGPALT